VAVEWGGLEGVEEVELGVEGVGQGFGDMRDCWVRCRTRIWRCRSVLRGDGESRKLFQISLTYVGYGEVFWG